VKFHIRQAIRSDIPLLKVLIDSSVRGLQAQDYTPAQMESALKTVYGVDSQLIEDGTYFVAEVEKDEGPRMSGQSRSLIVGCGGWSKRKTLYGGDHWTGRHDELLDLRHDAARIRAFFVHPKWARQGIGSMLLQACEEAAKTAGFTRLEMGATLTGVPFYRAKGYIASEHLEVPLGNGESLPIVRMTKEA
jgi:GNAT superfamily N-acetyltransferase